MILFQQNKKGNSLRAKSMYVSDKKLSVRHFLNILSTFEIVVSLKVIGFLGCGRPYEEGWVFQSILDQAYSRDLVLQF